MLSSLRYIFKALVIAVLLAPQSASAALPSDPFFMRLPIWQQIGLERAWDITTGSREVVVAVLDSGIDLNHPDLRDNIWVNTREVAGDGIDNDQNGYVDDVRGWDFVDNDSSPTPYVRTGAAFRAGELQHGTIIAGIIGAVGNNNQFSAGINWRVRIMPLRVIDATAEDGTQSHQVPTSNMNDAIAYATANGADVISVSLVIDANIESLQDAIVRAYNAGVTTVVSAGNYTNEARTNRDLRTKPLYPVCFAAPGIGPELVIGVASVDSRDTISTFSNYGAGCVDIAAPGEEVPSTLYQSAELNQIQLYGGAWNGTSFASPMVAGAVALMKAVYPALTPAQAHSYLTRSADSITAQNPELAAQVGAGRLNIAAALTLLTTEHPPSSVQPVAPVAPAQPTAPIAATPTPEKYRLVVGQDTGIEHLVRVFDSVGTVVHEFRAFGNTGGSGNSLTTGDTDGDGSEEIIVGAGRGGAALVRIFRPDGTLVKEFLAGEATDRRGVRVGVIDYDKNGQVEIVTAPLTGESQFITIYRPDGREFLRFSPGQRPYPFGLIFASGVVNGEPRIIVSEQRNGGQHIEAWAPGGAYVNEWFVQDVASQRPTLAMGDLTADGVTDILIGSAPGVSPVVIAQPFVFAAAQSVYTVLWPGATTGVSLAVAPGRMAVATGRNTLGVVELYSGSGQMLLQVYPFGSFYNGGVTVAFLR